MIFFLFLTLYFWKYIESSHWVTVVHICTKEFLLKISNQFPSNILLLSFFGFIIFFGFKILICIKTFFGFNIFFGFKFFFGFKIFIGLTIFILLYPGCYIFKSSLAIYSELLVWIANWSFPINLPHSHYYHYSNRSNYYHYYNSSNYPHYSNRSNYSNSPSPNAL